MLCAWSALVFLRASEIHSVLSFSNLKNSPLKIANQLGNNHLPLMIRAKQSCIYPNLLKKSINKIINDSLIDDINKQELLKLDSID